MNYDSLSIHLFHYIYQLLDLSAPTCKIKIFAKAKCPIVFFVQRNGSCSTIGKFTGPIFSLEIKILMQAAIFWTIPNAIIQ